MWTLLGLSCLFYVIGLLMPWNFGLFAIERYPYRLGYKIIFLTLVSSLSYLIFLNDRVIGLGYLKIIALGVIIGLFTSFLALVISYSIFYGDGVSMVGFDIIVQLLRENPLRNIVEFFIKSVLLLGWLYGLLISFTIIMIRPSPSIENDSCQQNSS